MSVTKLHQPLLQMTDAVFYLATALQFLQLHAVFTEPFPIGVCLGQLFLDFAVVINLTLLRVNQQDFSRLQAPFRHHIARLEVHDSHF